MFSVTFVGIVEAVIHIENEPDEIWPFWDTTTTLVLRVGGKEVQILFDSKFTQVKQGETVKFTVSKLPEFEYPIQFRVKAEEVIVEKE